MGTKRRDWEKIGTIAAKIRELKLTYKEGAERFGIKVWDLYDYNKRRNKGLPCTAAAKRQRSVSKPTTTLPDDVQELICDYRRSHPDHGFKRIEQELKGRHLVAVSRKQIRAVLKEAGLLAELDSSFDRQEAPPKGSRRFEASGPCELYQMDVTNVYLSGISVLYLVMMIDDHSRFCVAAELCRDQRADTLIGVLHNACTVHGKPRKLLTDQASGFYTWSMGQTAFQRYLDEHRIEHIVSEPHSPQTAGKVERLIQTVREELLTKVRFHGYEDARGGIRAFIDSYNFDRPHQGIGGLRPADRFHGVAGECSRMESELSGRGLDLSRGYLLFKVQGRILSAVCCSDGLRVLLDGKLLKEAEGNDAEC